MMTRTPLPLSACVAALGLVVSMTAPARAQNAAAGPRFLIKVGTLEPEGTPWHDALQEIGAKWKKASGGQISLTIYGGGVAGDEADMVRKMRIGQLQMGAFTAVGLETITREMSALWIPLLVQNLETGTTFAPTLRGLETDAIDAMVNDGLQIQTLTPQAEQEWRQMAEQFLYPKIRGTLVPADLFDEVTRLVSEYRAQTKPEPAKRPEPATKPEPAKTPEFTGLQVPALATVYVLDDSGRETKGMLVGLDAVSLVIRAGDGTVRRYEIANVTRISKRGDSLKNGIIAGAVFGAVVGALATGFVDGSAGEKALGFLAATGFYAAVGAGIDALIPGRTTIYQAWPAAKTGTPRSSAQRSLPGRIGGVFTVTW